MCRSGQNVSLNQQRESSPHKCLWYPFSLLLSSLVCLPFLSFFSLLSLPPLHICIIISVWKHQSWLPLDGPCIPCFKNAPAAGCKLLSILPPFTHFISYKWTFIQRLQQYNRTSLIPRTLVLFYFILFFSGLFFSFQTDSAGI